MSETSIDTDEKSKPFGPEELVKNRLANQHIPCDACSHEQSTSSKRCGKRRCKNKKLCPIAPYGTSVHFSPSLQTRLKYISHCSSFTRRQMKKRDVEEQREKMMMERKNKKETKQVMFPENEPIIRMPVPLPKIEHTPGNQTILRVPSPKTSGTVIAAQKTLVPPEDVIPPLPPKSAFEVITAHSGIIINKDEDYVEPSYGYYTQEKIVRPKKKKKCCRKRKPKTVCNKKCPKKPECRKYHKIRFGESADGIPDGTKRRKRRRRKSCGQRKINLDCVGDGKEEITYAPDLKSGMFRTHSLTILPCSKDRKPNVHYGILTGSLNMFNSRYSGRSRGKQALTVSVMAYCLAFHYHPKQWTMRLVDTLLDAGDTWYLQLLEKLHDHSAVQGVCEILSFGKKQSLHLNRKKMQILLGEPDIVGYTMSLDPTVYNLCRALKAFFIDNRACIFLTRVLKVSIWKDKICYYIFDPAGRDAKATTNFSRGCAALMNVSVTDLESVVEILMARTPVEDQKFLLAPIKVLKMLDENDEQDIDSEAEPTQAEKAMMGYRILNENCAIVNAKMHLGDRCFEAAKYRQALPIAVVAMTYAKISPPNTWHTKTLDKILRFGNKLYVECANPKQLTDLTIDEIPNEIRIGPYLCEIIIYREKVKGHLFTSKECLFNIGTGLNEFFNHEYNSAIVEFNNYCLAIWKQKEMFYVFDPYPRAGDGSRAAQNGKACVMMLLNTETVAEVFTANWNYLPVLSQFAIHGFKVLKLKKLSPQSNITCTLSEDDLKKGKKKQKDLELKKGRGDGKSLYRLTTPKHTARKDDNFDEENMGDIISLVDSIQESFLPPIPLRFKNLPPENTEPKVVNLDSPTVSMTQVIPPWPKPRDKTNEPPEPDPDPIPTPPPTPPPPEDKEEEAEDEELDEESMREELARLEEERRKREELPPPLPPPPPSPQPEPELAVPPVGGVAIMAGSSRTVVCPPVPEEEVEVLKPVSVNRTILLAEDAKKRYQMRQTRKRNAPPVVELPQMLRSASQELLQPHNFTDLLDFTQIVRGGEQITSAEGQYIMPFTAIVALIMSYKYSINTWTSGIVSYVVSTSRKLYENRLARFQFTPLHILPRVAIGSQDYHAKIEVVAEGTTWELESILVRNFFKSYDRGMITTQAYSAAFFYYNGLYYLYDPSPCNAMGLRDSADNGVACFLRFQTVHDLAIRINNNHTRGKADDIHFILSRIKVRLLLHEPRIQLPDDYDYETGRAKSLSSTMKVIEKGADKLQEKYKDMNDDEEGYQRFDSLFIIEGTLYLDDRKSVDTVKPSHFVCLVAMLLAAMRPISSWTPLLVDICIEKGLEIFIQATNLSICERRIIKNIILDGNIINVNLKKILIVNENKEQVLDHYLIAIMKRMRYVIITFKSSNFVIARAGGYYHVFDPNQSPVKSNVDDEVVEILQSYEQELKQMAATGLAESPESIARKRKEIEEDMGTIHKTSRGKRSGNCNACWSLYRSLDAVICKIRSVIGVQDVEEPDFYSFELASMKKASKYTAFHCKLGPLYRPTANPNCPFLKIHGGFGHRADEKMYWLDIDTVPWARTTAENGIGIRRRTFKSLWYDWDIEFPGDLFSIWGRIHPTDNRFNEKSRGYQYLSTSVIALGFIREVPFSAWTYNLLDGIVIAGDRYLNLFVELLGKKPNVEIQLRDLPAEFNDMEPYSINVTSKEIVFGFIYNILPDRFNLSNALSYFFEKSKFGMLICPTKNLAFGKVGRSFFMFDCQSYGLPIFAPGQGCAYILKCENINRLVYCMIVTLNVKRNGVQFYLYEVDVKITEKGSSRRSSKKKSL